MTFPNVFLCYLELILVYTFAYLGSSGAAHNTLHVFPEEICRCRTCFNKTASLCYVTCFISNRINFKSVFLFANKSHQRVF